MCKEAGLASMITLPEIHALVKKINSKVLAKGDLGVINFNIFTKFIINLVYLIFSRPPIDLRG